MSRFSDEAAYDRQKEWGAEQEYQASENAKAEADIKAREEAEMDKPTEAQKKELWEWCGFIYDEELTTGLRMPKGWRDPNGKYLWSSLPSIDLNNLSRYAIPKLQKEMKNWKAVLYNWIAGDIVDATTLFQAIWKAIKEVRNEEMVKEDTGR